MNCCDTSEKAASGLFSDAEGALRCFIEILEHSWSEIKIINPGKSGNLRIAACVVAKKRQPVLA
jgi:hypothetical protein